MVKKDEEKMKTGISHPLLALNRVTWLKSSEKLLLIDLFDNPERIFSLSLKEIGELIGRKPRVKTFESALYLKKAEADVKLLSSNTVHAVCLLDKEYPAQLADIYNPPFILFYRGMLPGFSSPFVAIVGTRKPTGNGRTAAFRLSMELSLAGIGVVSGLARGIDCAAHEGSLSGTGGKIAVLGNGIDRIYPTSSAGLAKSMLEKGGTIVSEYPPGIPPLKYNFPARNRIVSGLSRGIVIIEAPIRSGALITADFALEQGRDLFVHAVGVTSSVGEGTRKLQNQGAPVIDNAEDILSDWSFLQPGSIRRSESFSRDNGAAVKPGTSLARLLRGELDTEFIRFNGEIVAGASLKGASLWQS
jgi:DNA processing protein